MVKLEKSVQDNLNDLHDNHKMMISMKSASDKSKAVAEDVEKLSDDINFETLHINKVRTEHFVNILVQTRRFLVHFIGYFRLKMFIFGSKMDIFELFDSYGIFLTILFRKELTVKPTIIFFLAFSTPLCPL